MIVDRDNLSYYKLKLASNLGGSLEKNAFSYLESEKRSNEGMLHGIYKYKGF